MTIKLDKAKIKELIEKTEDDEINIETFRRKHDISPESSTLYESFRRFVIEGFLKKLGRGKYRKVEPIEPIKWWENGEQEKLNFKWPYGVDDNSSFSFEDSIEICNGDAIVIAGVSNQGKSAFAYNLLANNIDLFEGARLLVNEYNPQRFKQRMNKITWADMWDSNKPKFELLPCVKNHEDYVLPNHLIIVDWLLLQDEFWKVAGQVQDMEMKLKGKGVVVVILQKSKTREFGLGGDWGQYFPAVYATIDPPGKLTLVKVKSAPEGKVNPEGKMYAFKIVERGTQFHNIREVKQCKVCKGTGYSYGKECSACFKLGYVEIE